MDSWGLELQLYPLGLDVLGERGLDALLRDQHGRHALLQRKTLKKYWPRIDAGPLLDRLCLLLLGEQVLPAQRLKGSGVGLYCHFQLLVFNSLLLAMPIERLSDELLECRLAVEMGL